MDNDIKQFIQTENERLSQEIASLAVTVSAGFAKMDAAFRDVGGSIAGVMTMATKRFDRVDESLGVQKHEIDELRDRLKVLEVKVEKLEQLRV